MFIQPDQLDQSLVDLLEESLKADESIAEWLEDVDGDDGIGFEFNWDAFDAIQSLFESQIDFFRGEIDLDTNTENMHKIWSDFQSTEVSGELDVLSGIPNYVWGTSGNDKLDGSNKDDIIMGLGGRDKINGKGGDDQIVPGVSSEGKFTKVKGGKGSDIFEINVYAKVVIKDFDIAEDFLALDGGIDNARWEINGKKTHIYNFDGSDWVVLNGKVDLSEVMSL